MPLGRRTASATGRPIPIGRVLIVIGTRPEAIKLAPVIEALREDEAFDVKTCVTSQHADLLSSMLSFFGIPVDYDFRVMTPGQTLDDLTGRVLGRTSELLRRDPLHMGVVH